MAYEWGRVLFWLSQRQNAAAIQVFFAAITGASTVALLFVTWKYVRLTNKLMLFAGRSLEASVIPNLVFWFEPAGWGMGTLAIKNSGGSPVYLLMVKTHATLEEGGKFIDTEVIEVNNFKGVVLAAGEQTKSVQEYLKKASGSIGFDNVLMYVDCTDLLGIRRHQFHYQTKTGVTRYFSHPLDLANRHVVSPSRFQSIKRLLRIN